MRTTAASEGGALRTLMHLTRPTILTTEGGSRRPTVPIETQGVADLQTALVSEGGIEIWLMGDAHQEVAVIAWIKAK